jgi:hypothetical protein
LRLPGCVVEPLLRLRCREPLRVGLGCSSRFASASASRVPCFPGGGISKRLPAPSLFALGGSGGEGFGSRCHCVALLLGAPPCFGGSARVRFRGFLEQGRRQRRHGRRRRAPELQILAGLFGACCELLELGLRSAMLCGATRQRSDCFGFVTLDCG